VVRVATEDVEIEGTTIKQGDRVHLLLNAANRDAAQFPHPDTLDLLRDPNPHIAFGHGIHYCIGGPLARVEAQVAFATMLRRFDDLALEIDEPEWLDSMTFRGVRSLPVSFRAVRTAGAQGVG
jgi:cytochrome P450